MMAAERLWSEQRLLYLHAFEPEMEQGGAVIRARQLVAHLQELGLAARLELVEVPSGTKRRLRQMMGLTRGAPPAFARLVRSDLRTQLGEAGGRDLVVAGTLLASVAMTSAERRHAVLDAHNVESQVFELAVRSGSVKPLNRKLYAGTRKWNQWFEARVASQHRAIWAVSEQDVNWFAARTTAAVTLVRNGCIAPQSPTTPSESSALAFVGSLQTAFNRDGLAWFLAACWPAIRAAVPNAELVVAGASSGDFSGPGVRALGRVGDVGEVLSAARAVVVPLLAGGGSRLKVPEALGWGLPVVSTSIGAEGHGLSGHDGVVWADDALSFTAACVRLLTEPSLADALGSEGRRTAVQRLTWAAAAASAADSIATLGECDRLA